MPRAVTFVDWETDQIVRRFENWKYGFDSIHSRHKQRCDLARNDLLMVSRDARERSLFPRKRPAFSTGGAAFFYLGYRLDHAGDARD